MPGRLSRVPTAQQPCLMGLDTGGQHRRGDSGATLRCFPPSLAQLGPRFEGRRDGRPDGLEEGLPVGGTSD